MEANLTITGVLITVGVGVLSFLASQSWDVGKTIYRERKIRKALRKEIEEASPWLRRNILTFECMIQLSCVNALSNHGPAPVPVLVHAEHYPDIVLKLSTEEKALVNAIYNILYRLNKSAETISELNPQCLADEGRLQHLRLILDTAYRESRRALM